MKQLPLLLAGLALASFGITFGLTRLSQKNSAPQAPPGMVWIPGGEFAMGSELGDARPSKAPVHRVRVSGFWMDVTEVTNAQFRQFVDATGYVTTAERPPDVDELLSQLPPGTPAPDPALVVPGGLVFHKTDKPVAARRHPTMVELDARGRLAASRRAGFEPRRPRRSSRGSGLVGRCSGLRPLGRQAAAD